MQLQSVELLRYRACVDQAACTHFKCNLGHTLALGTRGARWTKEREEERNTRRAAAGELQTDMYIAAIREHREETQLRVRRAARTRSSLFLAREVLSSAIVSTEHIVTPVDDLRNVACRTAAATVSISRSPSLLLSRERFELPWGVYKVFFQFFYCPSMD